jgi:hypothetical protein
VWFRSGSGKEHIVGVTTTWLKAEAMAKDLYSVKSRIDKMNDISTGVYFLEDSILYTSTRPRRWQITPLKTSDV